MDGEIRIEEIGNAIRDIDSRKFAAGLTVFLRASERINRFLDEAAPLPEKYLLHYENSYQELIRESAAILSKSGISAGRIINYRFSLNGQSKGIPETDRLTEFWFRKIRKQQMELLSTINDEVGIIRDSIRQYKKMQEIMKIHSPAIRKAGNMMTLIRERIARRPTTLIQLESSEEKISELNRTFREMNEYENRQQVRLESGNSPEGSAFQLYHELGQGTFADIAVRQERLKKHIRELKKGEKLLLKLATGGYSPLMKKSLDTLNAKHEERSRNFRKNIRENRMLYCTCPSRSSFSAQ